MQAGSPARKSQRGSAHQDRTKPQPIRSYRMKSDTIVRLIAGALFLVVLMILVKRHKKIASAASSRPTRRAL
jgi:hypothetical protein